MVQIQGEYQLVEQKNFYEFLVGLGVPQETAKTNSEKKGTIGFSVNGDEITVTNNISKQVSKLVVGKEVEEKLGEHSILSTTKQEGNVLTITGKSKDGEPSLSRTMTFTDGGIEVVMTAPKDGKTFTATSVYKRI